MRHSRTTVMLTAAFLFALLSACDSTESQKQAAATAPPPGVLVAKASSEQLQETVEFIGRTIAVNDVSLTAQVNGYLQDRLFEEGSEVVVGDLLFRIDPSIYEALVAAAKGAVAKAEAALMRADKDLKRYQELLKKQSVSQQNVDQAESDQLQASAELQAARANLEKAETDLSFTEIRAPINGHMGQALVSVGNLVGPQTGVLARLVELDPIYVNFSVSEQDLLDVKQRQLKLAKEGEERAINKVQVALRLANKTIYEYKGEIDFLDTAVDPKTGTVTLRARFDNPDHLLVPGLFVRTILITEKRTTELMIPQAAVQEDQTGRFVMVVNPDDTIERRKIDTGRQVGANLVVTSGLNPDERVVVEGIQKVRPGMKVEPKMAPRPEFDQLDSGDGLTQEEVPAEGSRELSQEERANLPDQPESESDGTAKPTPEAGQSEADAPVNESAGGSTTQATAAESTDGAAPGAGPEEVAESDAATIIDKEGKGD